MANENLKQLSKDIVEQLWNQGDVNAIDKFYADDVKLVIRGGTFNGKDGVKQFMGMYREAFPDLKVEQHEHLTNGNTTALEWTFTGTHNGPIMGIEPTGKSVRVSGVTVSKYENNKVVEQHLYWDRLEQMQALGVGPEDLGKLQGR